MPTHCHQMLPRISQIHRILSFSGDFVWQILQKCQRDVCAESQGYSLCNVIHTRFLIFRAEFINSVPPPPGTYGAGVHFHIYFPLLTLTPCMQLLCNYYRFTVELCEPIQVTSLELANLEFFSSQPQNFIMHISDRWGTQTLGQTKLWLG